MCAFQLSQNQTRAGKMQTYHREREYITSIFPTCTQNFLTIYYVFKGAIKKFYLQNLNFTDVICSRCSNVQLTNYGNFYNKNNVLLIFSGNESDFMINLMHIWHQYG